MNKKRLQNILLKKRKKILNRNPLRKQWFKRLKPNIKHKIIINPKRNKRIILIF